jgi:hypothetical protein
VISPPTAVSSVAKRDLKWCSNVRESRASWRRATKTRETTPAQKSADPPSRRQRPPAAQNRAAGTKGQQQRTNIPLQICTHGQRNEIPRPCFSTFYA